MGVSRDAGLLVTLRTGIQSMHAGRAQRVPRILDPPGRLVPTPLTKLAWSAYLARELAGQARFPFAAPDVVSRAQRRRIRAMARHAYRTVPHYRDVMDRLGIEPASIATAEDLAQLPILEREALQQDAERLTSCAVAPRDRLTLRTGGSTGAPRAVHHSTRSIVRNAAHGERERAIIARAVGRQVGYRETVIGSPRSTAQEVQAHLRAHTLMPRGVRVERQYLSVLDPVAATAARLAEFAPHVVHGYGSYLAALFAYVRAHQGDFPLPRVVTFSSDGLSDAARALIRDELGVLVLGTYQAVEAFKIGFECGEGAGLHINTDLYPVRVVDAAGRDVASGEAGDLVVSNLVNDATVLLNYRLGDTVALLPGACACGRTLPKMTQPLGRLDDWLSIGGRQGALAGSAHDLHERSGHPAVPGDPAGAVEGGGVGRDTWNGRRSGNVATRRSRIPRAVRRRVARGSGVRERPAAHEPRKGARDRSARGTTRIHSGERVRADMNVASRLVNTAHVVALARRERLVPFWSPERIARQQTQRVRAIVEHAYASVPFYAESMRERQLTPRDIRSADDLALLPLIDSAILRADERRFLSSRVPASARRPLMTSGSHNGHRGETWWDNDALLHKLAYLERDRAVIGQLLGRSTGHRQLYLLPHGAQSFVLRDWWTEWTRDAEATRDADRRAGGIELRARSSSACGPNAPTSCTRTARSPSTSRSGWWRATSGSTRRGCGATAETG